jgi:hypothetical protein
MTDVLLSRAYNQHIEIYLTKYFQIKKVMICKNLYDEVLIKPCREGADTLKIISGYASSTMASEHLESLGENQLAPQISLFIGMCTENGLRMSDHQGFKNLMSFVNNSFKGKFECSYIRNRPPLHAKLYVWYKNGMFYKAFIGSANYTKKERLLKLQDLIGGSVQIGIPMKRIYSYILIYMEAIFSLLRRSILQ